MITQAQYTEFGTIHATIGGVEYSFHDDMANRHRQMLAEWEAEGNTIAPYVPPYVDPLIEIYANRLAAYKTESDPLKIEAEYDALINNTDPDYTAWIEKVQEIKERYPIGDD